MREGPEQVQKMLVDPSQVAPLQGHAVAVEEVEDLDGDLAAVLDPVAKLRGGEDSALGASSDIGHDGHHLVDRRAQEEMIMRYFICPPQTPGELEQPPNIALRE